MSAIKLLSQTQETVTLRRKDFESLLQAVEDRTDREAVARHRSYEKGVGWDAAKRSYLTREETERLLNGESPVRLWRMKRGMTQRVLAEAAHVGSSYLAEIEGGKKPGSAAALARIGSALEVPIEYLVR